MNRNAFSLVELSIVLVILGLLVGGVLSGQSLIRAAELRAVTSEYDRYITATQSFRDKYFAMPGDMNNATKFWGRLNGNADCVTNSGAAVVSPGTCDGNGDGNVDGGTVVSTSTEAFQFWRQLALAGLIEGTYTGISGPTAGSTPGWDTLIGTNAPRSRMGNSGWGEVYFTVTGGGDSSTYVHDYGNMLSFGGQATSDIPISPNLKPEEAWNIDTKMDDGRPASGKVWARDGMGWGTPNACTTSTSQTDYSGAYKLATTVQSCSFFFATAF